MLIAAIENPPGHEALTTAAVGDGVVVRSVGIGDVDEGALADGLVADGDPLDRDVGGDGADPPEEQPAANAVAGGSASPSLMCMARG